MSKIETGKVTLKNEVIVCQPFLSSINTIIQSQAAEKNVTYEMTQFADCKNGYLGDGVRLAQILINILSNAVKFTPSGGTVHLDITQIPADENIANICFTITDTGIGITETFLPNIFKPFSQEHHAASSGYGGSGLGLAISKNLIQLMNGTISVESTLGKGTTFTVIIPFQIPTDSDEIVEKEPLEKSNDEYDFSGKNILLVEDHPLNIMVAKKLLEFKHAMVDVAENGKIGLDMFANAP
ncbi:MAG: ATP-binding protein, partial [Christensenellaceae bacterium]